MEQLIQIPEVLKGKLVFGDCDQILALQILEQKHKEYYGGDGDKRWAVYVEVELSETIMVTAKNKEEAIEKAKEQFDLDCNGYTSFSAREVGK